jgi:uncharacterized membrane protein (UPF0127 family)
MDRRTTIIILLFVVVCFASFSTFKRSYTTVQASCKTHHDTYDVKKVTIDSKNFNVLVADSPAKWEYGLMNVKSKQDICGHDGMTFTFPIAMPQTFWNKNTFVDLDIYWMNGEKKVGQSKLPSITKSGLTTVSSPEAVDGVVEIFQ